MARALFPRSHPLQHIAFTTGWFIFILFNYKVDLKRRALVTRILTQGRQDANQWVTSYTVSYSNNGRTFRPYTKRGRVKVPCTKIGLQCVHEVNLLSRTEKWIVPCQVFIECALNGLQAKDLEGKIQSNNFLCHKNPPIILVCLFNFRRWNHLCKVSLNVGNLQSATN